MTPTTTPDDELDNWDELLTGDVNANDRPRHTDMEAARTRWESDKTAPVGATETLSRDYDSRYDPRETRNAGVIRTVAGALDPRTFNSKLRWAAVILVLLAGVAVPFAIGAGAALMAGAPSAWAAVVGVAVTMAYWRYF